MRKNIFILLLIFLLGSANVDAAMKNPFSDSSSLQPLPAGIRPNISENVNSIPSSDIVVQQQNISLSNNSQLQQNIDNEIKDRKSIWPTVLLWGALFIGLVFSIILILRYRKEEKKDSKRF